MSATTKASQTANDPLRVALNDIKEVLVSSDKSLFHLIVTTGHDPKISPSWFSQYLAYKGSGQGKTIDVLPRQQLEAFAFRSPLGRALRALKTKAAPEFDKLMGVLASGHFTRPPETKVAGRYFVYHGSYVKPEHYVVRTFDISCIDGSLLVVKDSINDNITMQGAPRYAHGVVTFVHARPQILLYAKENKAGLCLFIGGETIFYGDERTMVSVTGAFIAQRTTNNNLIYRRALLLREPDATAEAMLEETGIFTRQQLEEESRARHFAAFELLAEHLPHEGFADPILTFLRRNNAGE